MRKINKILLVAPKSISPVEGLRRLTTPINILYIASVLKSDYEVKIIDCTGEGYDHLEEEREGYISYGLSDEDFKRRLLEFNPDIVGVSSPFSQRHKKAMEICKIVKENLDIPIVMGGTHPSFFPEQVLKSGAVDYVIMGEGEYRMRDLLRCLNEEREPDFDGVAYKKDKKVIIKPVTTLIENLDNMPFPAREFIDMERYFKIAMPFAPYSRGDRPEGILTSRGCPFNCFFCSSINFWGRKFRMRSVENIIEEIKELVEKYKVDEIQFIDDNLTCNKNRAKELFKQLKQFNLHWCTPQGLMINTLDEEMIKLMAESGCYQISIAVESGSERVRREIIRKTIPSKERVKELIDICHNNGIQVHGFFITGLLKETREEIFQTLNYPFEVGFDSVVYSMASPLPGSELYYEVLHKGYISNETNTITDFRSGEIIIPKDSPDYYGMEPEELEELIKQKTEEFNKFSKARNPESWETKFTPFLKRHPEHEKNIFKRVS